MEHEEKIVTKTEENLDLLSRHIHMLMILKEHGPTGIIRLSEMLNVPKHKIRYSLRLLEKDGVIQATTEGAVVSTSVDEYLKDTIRYLDELEASVVALKKEISATL